MRIDYRPDIDGLRAFAVLSVLGFHAFPWIFPGGFIGVDVFFVISGFLITSILFAELQGRTFNIFGFFARRVLRIFPALLLVLLACLLAGWFTLLADEYKQLGKHIAAGAGFFANLALWFEAGYFDRASEVKPLLHLWSLGIEEQFYIAWPLILWGMWRLPRGVRGVTLAMLVVSLLYASVLVFVNQTQTFYAPWTRAWELFAGALLALQLQQTGTLPAWMRLRYMQWGALVLLLLGVFLLRSEYPFPGALALIPVSAAAVLIAGTGQGQGQGTVTRLLASRPMVAVGLISYPLYLWHWPLLSYAHIFENGQPPALVRLALLVLAFSLAALTYWGVERPLRRLPQRWVVGVLVALVVFVGLLGNNIDRRDGLERIRHRKMIQLSEQAQQDFVDFEKVGLITEDKCEIPFRFPEREVCLFTRRELPVNAVLVGDSHAVHAFWGLSKALESSGDNLQVRGRGACAPLLGLGTTAPPYHCQPGVDQTWQTIAADASIRKVFIVYRGRYLLNDATQEQVQVYKKAMDRTLQMLESAGKRVYYFLPLAEPGFDPRLCLGKLPMGRKPPRSCVIDLTADQAKTRVLGEIVAAVMAQHPNVRFLDPTPAYCENGICGIIQDGHSVFKDENHLSYYGSMLVGSRVKLD
jgi:peptidoglycan/LPS O-acetylase OafA/YrhL